MSQCRGWALARVFHECGPGRGDIQRFDSSATEGSLFAVEQPLWLILVIFGGSLVQRRGGVVAYQWTAGSGLILKFRGGIVQDTRQEKLAYCGV